MTLQPVLSAKLYLILGCNIILHCQFQSTLDVTISLHSSSWMIFPTDTHTCSRCNFAVWSKLARLLQGDLHCFVCLQYLLPLLQNFPSSLCGELVLLPWQPASSSGGCSLWETISSSRLDHKIGCRTPSLGQKWYLPCWPGGSVKFSSVAQSCPTLCDPMDCSTPGLPVHHQLPEFTQTHVCWVGDASNHLILCHPPSPPAFNLSQHQGLFKWVSGPEMDTWP